MNDRIDFMNGNGTMTAWIRKFWKQNIISLLFRLLYRNHSIVFRIGFALRKIMEQVKNISDTAPHESDGRYDPDQTSHKQCRDIIADSPPVFRPHLAEQFAEPAKQPLIIIDQRQTFLHLENDLCMW